MPHFFNNLIGLAAARGLSIRAVSDGAGLPPSTLSRYVRRGPSANIRTSTVLAVAEFFGVSPEDMAKKELVAPVDAVTLARVAPSADIDANDATPAQRPHVSTNTHFVSTLRSLMGENHLSVRKLADLSGLAPATIQRLTSGKSAPRKDTIDALAEAFGVSFEDTREVVTPSPREIPVFELSFAEKFLLGGHAPSDSEYIALPPDTTWTVNSPTPDFAIIAETAAMAPQVIDGDILYFKSNWRHIKTGQIILAETENDGIRIGRLKRDISDIYLSFDNDKEFNLTDLKVKNILACCVGLYRQLL